MADLLTRPDLATSRHHFERLCAAARTWDALYTMALIEQGGHGVQVSGIGRNHFAPHTKRRLRRLIQTMHLHEKAAYASRPPRVRLDTIRTLGRTIATRSGSGFYGPQPFTKD